MIDLVWRRGVLINCPVSYRLTEVDEFIAKLWAIHLTVKGVGYSQVIAP
jgi:hypothetical protein